MATTQAPTEASVPVGTWRSDPIHSHAGFSVRHQEVGTFRAAFGRFEATLTAAEGEEPLLEGTVLVDSVDVRNDDLRGHLLAPDFFDAERNPEITFASSAIRREGDEIVVEGDLTVQGKPNTVEARGTITDPVEGPGGVEKLGLDLETVVDRTEFGIEWNMELPSGGLALGDEVTITVHLELAKEA